MIELTRSAVEAALAAGASDAEAYASEESGREVRAHGGAIESLTAATKRGIGVRAWIGKRAGYAFGTDLSAPGLTAIATRAAEAARAADPDEFAAPAELPVRLFPDKGGKGAPALELSDPSVAAWSVGEVAELALAVERVALEADSRVVGVEQAVYADAAERVAIASSTGIVGEHESTSCYAYVQALAEGEDGRETGLGFGLGRGPAALDPGAIGREGAERASAMIGAAKPESRSCPGRPRPNGRRQLRRPDRPRPRRRRGATRPLALRRAGRRPRLPTPPSSSTTTASTPRDSPRRRSTARACRGGERP